MTAKSRHPWRLRVEADRLLRFEGPRTFLARRRARQGENLFDGVLIVM